MEGRDILGDTFGRDNWGTTLVALAYQPPRVEHPPLYDPVRMKYLPIEKDEIILLSAT